MENKKINILGIESSCDDTSASVIQNGYLLSNVIANQEIHQLYGGVVPELASRAHQSNIIPVVAQALKIAGVEKNEISGVAFTRGPGLLGSLLVGTSFAKGFCLARDIPLIEVNHLQGHILSPFILEYGKERNLPKFPFISMLVSGGHTQLLIIKDFFDMEIVGQTIDDAAGEAFDKCAKVMGLDYPGGPIIDKFAKIGNPKAFKFSKPQIKDYDFSFSGLKTSFLYFLRDSLKDNPSFIQQNTPDLCASLQYTIIEILLAKLKKLVKDTGIKEISVGGGVAANSGLRSALELYGAKNKIVMHIPERKFTTDNAAMIAIAGYYKFLRNDFSTQDIAPDARLKF